MSQFQSMIVGIGLDDSAMRAGLTRVKAENAAAARAVEGSWAKAGKAAEHIGAHSLGVPTRYGLGVGGGIVAVTLLAKGIREAVKQNEELEKGFVALGLDHPFELLAKGVGEYVAMVAKAVRPGGRDPIMDLGRDIIESEQRIKAETDRLDLRRAAGEVGRDMLSAESQIARLELDPRRADQLEERARHEAKIAQIQKEMMEAGKNLPGRLDLEDSLHDARLRNIDEEARKREEALYRTGGDIFGGLAGEGRRLSGSETIAGGATTGAEHLAAQLAAVDERLDETRDKLRDHPFFKSEALGNFGPVLLEQAIGTATENAARQRLNLTNAWGKDRLAAARGADAEFDQQQKTWAIEQLRMKGLDDRANKMELALKFEKEIETIGRQDFLSDAERASRIGAAERARDSMLGMLGADRGGLRGMVLGGGGIGLGGAGGELLGQVIGGGRGAGGRSVEQEQLGEAKRTTEAVDDARDVLLRIEQKIGQPTQAVLA